MLATTDFPEVFNSSEWWYAMNTLPAKVDTMIARARRVSALADRLSKIDEDQECLAREREIVLGELAQEAAGESSNGESALGKSEDNDVVPGVPLSQYEQVMAVAEGLVCETFKGEDVIVALKGRGIQLPMNTVLTCLGRGFKEGRLLRPARGVYAPLPKPNLNLEFGIAGSNDSPSKDGEATTS
jgi:hypothetical protein